jgi:5-methylcytosine-specific restriction enzyme subunit McrC
MMRLESITESKETTLQLSRAEAESLQQLGRRLASQQRWWGDSEARERSVIECSRGASGSWKVLVREAVGMISAGDLQIRVQPKIPLQHFLFLARKSDLFPRTEEQPVAIEHSDDLWSLVARWFLRAAEKLLRRELARGYTELTDEVREVRGQTLPLETARAFYNGRPIVHCLYEEFSEDTPLNRLLKAAAEIVAGAQSLAPDLRRRAKHLLARMEGVGSLKLHDLRARVDRLTQHYASSVAFAKYLISGSGVHISHGSHAAWSFLVRSPEIIESGVRQTLKEELRTRWQVEKTEHRLRDSAITLNPDLVFDKGAAVADVKYKLSQRDWVRPDLYQAVAFATAFQSAAAAVIGFRTDENADIPQAVTVGRLPVRYFVWRAQEALDPQEAGRDLALQVDEWLAQVARTRLAA